MKIPVYVPAIGDSTAYTLRKNILEFRKRYELNLYSKLPRPAHMQEDMARRAELKEMEEELSRREASGPDGETNGLLIAFVPAGDNISAVVEIGGRFLKFDLEEIRPASGSKETPDIHPAHPHSDDEAEPAELEEPPVSFEEPEPDELPDRSGVLPVMPK